jgi:hypothetical protein
MSDERKNQQNDIIKRLNTGTLSDEDILILHQLLGQDINQTVSQSGSTNVTLGESRNFQIGDRYTGATTEQIRVIVREILAELKELQPFHTRSTVTGQDSAYGINYTPFQRLTFDQRTLEIVNSRLEVLQEINDARYLSEAQIQELAQIKQRLHAFRNLNQELQEIADQGDRLMQEAVEALRLQLNSLKLSGRTLTQELNSQTSNPELECQQAETQIFQSFSQRLEDSRLGADWITNNLEILARYASNSTIKRFPGLNLSEQVVDDFRFSLKQFLEQVSFGLYWGSYEILDSPEIPLVLAKEQYEVAFQEIRQSISKQLDDPVIHEIENCIYYLLDRLQFY